MGAGIHPFLLAPLGSAQPLASEHTTASVPLEDQSVIVSTTTAPSRIAAPRGTLILILILVEAPAPGRWGGRRCDVGHPAARFLLLLLGTRQVQR